MLHYLRLLFAAAAVCCALDSAGAQSSHHGAVVVIGKEGGTDGTHCEDTMAVFDLIAQDAGGEGVIIIIARLGRGETSRGVGRLRLRNVREHLRLVRGVEDGRIVTAEGERVGGLGKVEVYVGGKLHSVFYMKRNRDFRRGCGV